MTFGEPVWFWAFALFPLLIALFFRNEALRKRALERLIAARLIPRLANSASIGKRRARFIFLLLGLAGVIVSMARPQWGFTWQERRTSGRDVIIAIDASRSMLANDLAPNRLTRAKLAAEDLISQLKGDRVGLIAFAGSAFLQAPLTADHSAVLNALYEIDTEIIPRGGSNIAGAISTAVEAFGKGESDNRALVIFTDGEELDADGVKAAREQKEIAKIYTVGVGSPEGTVIALPGAGGAYLTDPSGQIVKSRLDEDRLQEIAEAGGGFYVHLQNGPAEMRQLITEGIGGMSEKESDSEVTRQPIERYQWPLGIGMIFLCLSILLGERRRISGNGGPRSAATVAASLAAMLLIVPPAYGNSPRELYEKGQFSEAQKAYEELLRKNPESDRLAFNHGAAAYKNRDYKAALQSFGKALTTKDTQLRAQAEYNIGNTLFQQALGGSKGPDIAGLESALSHFDEARKLQPSNEDANYNYEATRKLIEQLKQQQEQQKQEEQQKDQDKKEEEKKDQQDQQKSGGKDQKDQQKKEGQDDQEQSQNQSGQDQKENQSDQQQQQNGQSEQSEQEGQDKQDMDQNQQGQADQKPDEQKQKGQEADKQQSGNQGEPENGQGEQQENRKLEGELKNNPAPGQQPEQSDAEREAAEEALAAAEGRMTEAQARALLDSLKNEDARVQLLDPRERRRERPLRDW